jgi:hypothetical protein
MMLSVSNSLNEIATFTNCQIGNETNSPSEGRQVLRIIIRPVNAVRRHMRMGLGEECKEERGVTSSKDGANGEKKKFPENGSEDNHGIWMVEDPVEGGLNVINELQDIRQRVGNPKVPDLCQVAVQCSGVVDGRAFVLPARRPRRWYAKVSGTVVVRGYKAGGVDAKTAFAFPDGPYERSYVDADQKTPEETRQRKMIALCFLLRYLLPDFIPSLLQTWVIVVPIAVANAFK